MLKCKKCNAEIDNEDVIEHAREELALQDVDETRDDLYVDGYVDMSDPEERTLWLEKNASAYGYEDISDCKVLGEIVAENAADFDYLHKSDVPDEIPEEVQRELWNLGVIYSTEHPTWDDVVQSLRGFVLGGAA